MAILATCFGHSAGARVADETDALRISEWYQEEFLAVNGEHICFHYRREDDTGVSDGERQGGNNRLYPQRTDYANVKAHGSLYCLAGDMPAPDAFLLHIVFDYGERTLQKAEVPPWTAAAESGWLLRRDPFSLYSAGFETRCRRLCRQILMFSRKADDLKRDPVMVNRYLFEYTESPVMTCLSRITRLAYETVDGTLRVAEKPPVVFTYTDAKLTTGQADYVPLMNWPEVDRATGQLVDLYGIHRRDLITRQEQHTTYNYRGGRYDTDKRRYCGYYRVDETDDCGESNKRNDTPLQRPRLRRRWYHTGAAGDAVKREGYFSSPVTSDSLLTRWQERKDRIIADNSVPSLHYALKGALLREELFDSEDTAVPFSVQEHRYQIRLLQQNGDIICAAPLLLETLSINYQQSEKDIACQQQIVMDYSEYGEALHEITVFLPRQSGVEENPYPAVTPLQWQNSFDDAQTLCWFTETRRLSLSMITPDRWLPVLPECSWQESVSLTGNEMNGNTIFSREILQAKDNPLAGKPRTLLAWQKECYQQDGAEINYPPRVTGQEQAVFNDITLQPYHAHLSDDELTQQLSAAGYQKRTPEELKQSVWVSSGNTLTYLDADGFYLPAESKNPRGGVQIFHYNTYYRMADSFTDEFGQKTQVTEIDERFWQPVRICDINNNTSEVRLNAFGDITATSQYGTEGGQPTGFKPVSEFIPPERLTLAQAIEKSETLLGGQFSVTLYHENELSGDNPQPAWVMTISASDYPGTPDMAPCRIDITYFDGTGHPRQQFSLDEPGAAYPCAGGVLLQDDNQLKEVVADTRWRIMQAPETTLSGNAIRRFRAWFSDSYEPVIDTRLSDLIPCEVIGYDAQDKPVFVQDAEGYLRYQRYFPWFNLDYDENDTLSSGFDLLRLFQRQSHISAGPGNYDELFMERGIYGQMTEIDKPYSEKIYADNIQRYYFNGGRETWLPDAGITLIPGPDILRPYAMPQVWYGENNNDS